MIKCIWIVIKFYFFNVIICMVRISVIEKNIINIFNVNIMIFFIIIVIKIK